jgi:hypothetical protein
MKATKWSNDLSGSRETSIEVPVNDKTRTVPARSQQLLSAAVNQAAGHVDEFLHYRPQASAFGRVTHRRIRPGQSQSHPAQQVVPQRCEGHDQVGQGAAADGYTGFSVPLRRNTGRSHLSITSLEARWPADDGRTRNCPCSRRLAHRQ